MTAEDRERLIAEAERAAGQPELPIRAGLILELLVEIAKNIDRTYEAVTKYTVVPSYETPSEAYARGAVNEAKHIFGVIAEQAEEEAHDPSPAPEEAKDLPE